MPHEMLFCSLFKRSHSASSRRHACDINLPLMDLSLLVGSPLPDSGVIVPFDSTFPRIQEEPPTPVTGVHYRDYHNLYTKPLPPRPASVDPSDLRQLRQSRSDNHNVLSQTNPSLSDRHLRRMPAQRGRRIISNGSQLSDGIAAADPVRDARSRSPPLNPYLSTECRMPRQPQSVPLVWLDEEELWVIAGDSQPSPRPPIRQSRPTRLETHLSEPPWDGEVPDAEDIGVSPLSPPPSYDSHGFSHTHVMRQQRGLESRWSAVARRVHDSSNG